MTPGLLELIAVCARRDPVGASPALLLLLLSCELPFSSSFPMLHPLHPRSQASSPPAAVLWCPLCQRLARWIRESAEPNVVSRLSESCQRLCVASARAGIAQSGYAAWAT